MGGKGEGLSRGDWGNMSGGKLVVVEIRYLVREAMRCSEDQMGESASSESSLGRYSSFWWERDLQWRTACSKVSRAAQHLEQIERRSR